MRPATRSVSAMLLALLLAAPSIAFQFPLSDSAARAAYFLGQRIGSEVHLSLPAGVFASDSAAAKVFAADGHAVRAEFNLATLR